MPPSALLPRSAIVKSAELAVGGDLRSYLRKARRAEKSFNDISFELRTKNVVVTYETVRAWCRRLGLQ